MAGNNHVFLLTSLVLRDFRIRYRSMSLGVFWSLLNPLVMMGVLTFIFTRIFPESRSHNLHLSILSGLVLFNFFSLSWSAGTVSLLDSASLIKRVPMPRVWIPVSAVLSNTIHLLIQIGLLLLLVVVAGIGVNIHWLLLPWILAMEVMFVCGLCLITSALHVYFRDVRYVVESAIMVLFWMVPVVYSFEMIPARYHSLYWYNPVAAVVIACRSVLLEGRMPAPETLAKLTAVSVVVFTLGLVWFQRLRHRFADYV